MSYSVYILRTSSNTLYIGQTNNLEKRLREHKNKSSKSAKYIRYFFNFKLVYSEKYPTRKEAMQRENQLKKWSKTKKEALIKGCLLMKHHVIIIPGLVHRRLLFKKILRLWQEKGIESEIFWVNWLSRKTDFSEVLNKLCEKIDILSKKGTLVSLVGTSAGGSLAVNVFSDRINKIHRVILVCSPLTEKGSKKLFVGKKLSPIFRESILICEKKKKFLSVSERKRILLILPRLDELVPVKTMKFSGAEVLQINTLEHFLSIKSAMTKKIDQIIKHLDLYSFAKTPRKFGGR